MPQKFRGLQIFHPAGIQIGDNGDRITEFLAGSAQFTTACIADAGSVVGSASITGLSASHKLIASASATSGSLILEAVSPSSAGGDVLVAVFRNRSGATAASFQHTISYIAILDK